MAEGDAGSCPPQVFVVDRQAGYLSMPGEARPRWAKVSQKCLLPLVGLALLGLVVQGCFIYTLYQRMQECHNPSHPHTSGQEEGRISSQKGTEESNNIPDGTPVTPHLNVFRRRPFAQLIGSYNPKGNNNVVLWESKLGQSVTHHMGYEDGKLLVEKEGYYFLYSKVTFDSPEKCVFTQHKMIRNTTAYDDSIELLRSKNYLCPGPRRHERWNSVLSGIFHLLSGDKIFVKLDDVKGLQPGPLDNVMGAFMLYPGSILL